MDLDQMRGFLETAREKSFTRAAEKLFLTQPAVSLQVKALEEENYSASFLKKHYEDKWRAEIGFELQMHEALRELFDSLSDEKLEELFDLAVEERIDELMVKYQDTDRPSEFVKELLKNERMLSALEKFLNYDLLAKT